MCPNCTYIFLLLCQELRMSSFSLRQDVIDLQNKFPKQVNSLGKTISFLSFKRTITLENLKSVV